MPGDGGYLSLAAEEAAALPSRAAPPRPRHNPGLSSRLKAKRGQAAHREQALGRCGKARARALLKEAGRLGTLELALPPLERRSVSAPTRRSCPRRVREFWSWAGLSDLAGAGEELDARRTAFLNYPFEKEHWRRRGGKLVAGRAYSAPQYGRRGGAGA